MNGTIAEFSPRVDEFEALIGETLSEAIEKNIMLYYSPMVAEVQQEASETIIVTVSISAIMNESATLKLDTAAAVAVYISSLISRNQDFFATYSFDIVSISIFESGSGGDTIIMTTNNNEEEGLSDGVLSGMVILGLAGTLTALAVVFMLIYIRYATIRRPQMQQERLPLIPDNEVNQRYQQVNLNLKEV
ncbi:hypothetical protein GBAR_LOCUS6345 [Geodia barretti]|uniref:Uncharacterized protein n=1 Tax=Geodia barretti TaxID=519541 RepID=A0AA35W9X4_GEOBA|nr:hypothetical protein GBAR_LOCUS6345 [Geodia barretti]